MKRIATQLASQMNDAGITPTNFTNHPAHVFAGKHLLKYAMDENNNAVLGQWACTLHQDGGDWICWNDHGSSGCRISYKNGTWEVSKV